MRTLEGFGPYSTEPNPCVRVWGPGPEGTTCRTCDRLIKRGWGLKTFYKCPMRKITRGPGTDHRVGWRSCAKYLEEGADDLNRLPSKPTLEEG